MMNMKKTSINKRKIEKLVRELIVQLGENPDREGLQGTPKRMADMFDYC
jgi:GTP cyclohydrolase IA